MASSSSSASVSSASAGSSSHVGAVQLEGLAMLKIVKHCKESLPDLVTGQLLGLDVDSRLEVTNCFPFPNREDDENSEDTGAEYQLEMMRCMREVNVDNNTVGWYQSAYLGSYVNESMVETQFNYQQNLKKSVVIVFDPVLSTDSHLSLKAFRLTDQFMTLFAGRKFTAEALKEAQVDFSKVFEEVPIEVHNAHLCRALLFELESEQYLGAQVEPNLDLPATSVLEKNLEFLIEYGDHLSADHSKLQYHQRALHRQRVQQSRWVQQRKAENALRRRDGKPELSEVPDPNQFEKVSPASYLKPMLNTNQLNTYCEQVKDFVGESTAKLYLMQSLSS